MPIRQPGKTGKQAQLNNLVATVKPGKKVNGGVVATSSKGDVKQ
jgi:hypothetical protein